ncbi:MAG: type VII toxin-antitoxin system MntA family adenylyltransferase antitoxin [Moorellales bacterium]
MPLKPGLTRIGEKIAPVLEKFGVHTCYLFGSYAHGQATPASDVDLAVVFSGYEPTRHDLDLLTEMEAELARALAPRAVDLVFLQREGIAFRFEVVSTGTVVYCRDHVARTDFEDGVIRDYLDFAPMLARCEQELAEAIREGHFFA